MPTFNHGPTLLRSVPTALNQTVSDLEVFIIGDGVSDSTREIIADILELPLETIAAPQDAGAIGAAACAIVGSGAQSDYSFLADRVAVTNTYLPDADRSRQYCARYAQYQRLYDALYPIYHEAVQ